MIRGLSGPLLSHDAILALLASATLPGLASQAPAETIRHLRAWHAAVRHRLGPASSARAVFDLVGEPLATALGFRVVLLSAGPECVEAVLQIPRGRAPVMVVTGWGQSVAVAWRLAVHRALACGTRWALCVTGSAFRLFDVDRAYARRYAEFDLQTAVDSDQTLGLLWGICRAASFEPEPEGPLLDRAVAYCERHRAAVRVSLRDGVHDALLQLVNAFRTATLRRHADADLLDESLIVVYRILFLLFAEARGLVPSWHPVYRDGYTIDTLRRRGDPAAPTGLWETLQAIARLAQRGCRAGTLRVPPFNGRLFSASNAPLADRLPLDDCVVARALDALTTRKGHQGPESISYADLGVEQLGAVYEHLLDYDLVTGIQGAPASLVPTGRRKATGSFYTPRSLTEFLVRRALAPLVRDARPEGILSLRVLDPAMGSGAFLVAACRYLASAYEQALVREGALSAADVTEEDRAQFRRSVAQKCLFGVDVNPMAVQLGRLSLWLATLSADKPLSFLDHHLRAGDSLVGASTDDILRHPAPGHARRPPPHLPLFQIDALQSSIEHAVGSRCSIAETPDDTIEQVRQKERLLSTLNRAGGPLDRWRAAADIWCAAWYSPDARPAGRPVFEALLDRLMRGTGALPDHTAEALLRRARAIAAERRFFHWTFEFPEIFHDGTGTRRPDGGFDVIIGNPPWEMLRDDGGARGTGALHRFVRGSGLYPLQGHGHSNLYQLFIERTLRLLRPGGRSGLILPAGFATDHGAGSLRRYLLDRTRVDTFTTIENRDGIFPIHRALKFLLLTFDNQGSTAELPAHAGVRSTDVLDRIADLGPSASAIPIPRALFAKASGGDFAIPELEMPLDLEILTSIAVRTPAACDPEGWGIHFGRELNATEDRVHFRSDGVGLPVLEGKQLHPFELDHASVRFTIAERDAAALLNADATFRRARLAYRDVASASNRLTLIAAIVPARAVTTHTIFCLKEPLDETAQLFLCGVFNSYVANYLVRMRVKTHVTAAVVAQLPLPKPTRDHPLFERIAALSRDITAGRSRTENMALLNALVARLYGLSTARFARVLETFPLEQKSERDRAFRHLEADTSNYGIL